jgi:hypothetical protein
MPSGPARRLGRQRHIHRYTSRSPRCGQELRTALRRADRAAAEDLLEQADLARPEANLVRKVEAQEELRPLTGSA